MFHTFQHDNFMSVGTASAWSTNESTQVVRPDFVDVQWKNVSSTSAWDHSSSDDVDAPPGFEEPVLTLDAGFPAAGLVENSFKNVKSSSDAWDSDPVVDSDAQSRWYVAQKLGGLKNSEIEEEITSQNRYKTELCRGWMETGSCRYGSKCQFAHGVQELRPVIRHPKYKTEVCKTFSSTGTCPYGRRCRFLHTEADTQVRTSKKKGLPFFQKIHRSAKSKKQ
eukprot:TRINITY_DN508_c0_g1_i1.p2 TRINITY_DN508_c0_g1~~TRINITY_DN508_c0_g1_i1.p2  ORF type:complete len:222 (-),score=45.45 TRINITY_DN508_c0_g1_i1:48-713(-)